MRLRKARVASFFARSVFILKRVDFLHQPEPCTDFICTIDMYDNMS